MNFATDSLSVTVLAILTSLLPSDDGRPAGQGKASAESASQEARLTERLKLKAAHIEKDPLSPLFSAAVDQAPTSLLHPSPEQVSLARSVDELLRDILKAWILRDVDAVPALENQALSDRLSRRGDEVMAGLVDHGEQLVLHCILSSAQVLQWQKSSGRKPGASIAGRYGSVPIREVAQDRSISDLAADLREFSSRKRRGSKLLCSMVVGPEFRQMYPDGIGHLTPAQQARERAALPRVELPPGCSDLLTRLDQLTVKLYQTWMIRDLDRNPLPPRATLVHRLQNRVVFEHNLMAHAEALALEGILTRDQADRCLAVYWVQEGSGAFYDPAFRSKLKISAAQRESVFFLLGVKEQINEQLDREQASLQGLTPYRPDLQSLSEQLSQGAANRRALADDEIENLLTPLQAGILQRIFIQSKRATLVPPAAPARVSP